ncbi:MAG: permease prefix domain 1-containing protein [Planctomycetota bacterium]
MSEREFEAYLNLLARTLKLSDEQRARIAGELRDHLEERLAELTDAGMDRDAAVLAALDEFGDANVLAHDLTEPRHRLRRRRLMQTSFATLAAASVVALGFFYLMPATTPSGQPTLPRAAAQAEGAGQDPAEFVPPVDPLEKIISVRFEDTPIEEVFAHLGDVLGLNVYVDWGQLEANGLAPDRPITLDLQDVRARTALDLLARSGQAVDYAIRDNVLIVALAGTFVTRTAPELEVRMYAIDGLLENASLLYGGDAPLPQQTAMLLDFVGSALGEIAWREGESIGIFAGVLVVRQTPDRHDTLVKVLQQLERRLAERAADERERRKAIGQADGFGLRPGSLIRESGAAASTGRGSTARRPGAPRGGASGFTDGYGGGYGNPADE